MTASPARSIACAAPAAHSTTSWADALDTLPAASPLPFALDARRCLPLDLRDGSGTLGAIDPADTVAFGAAVDRARRAAGADYAAGGYAEDRGLYRRSPVFDDGEDDRRTLHLGIDLWLDAGTSVHAVLGGRLHSLQDNARFGDYGPTLILEHEVEGLRFHTLYGHLARRTLSGLRAGQAIATGERLGWLGTPEENLGWPPHLHFQIIRDLGGRHGDYPGVCRRAEAAAWLANCPDPNRLLRIPALRNTLACA